MKTYYIVEGRNSDNLPLWNVYKRGILSTLGVFNDFNMCLSYGSSVGADPCESNLRKYLEAKNFKAKVIRVVKM